LAIVSILSKRKLEAPVLSPVLVSCYRHNVKDDGDGRKSGERSASLLKKGLARLAVNRSVALGRRVRARKARRPEPRAAQERLSNMG
jgi:hypothetical protein